MPLLEFGALIQIADPNGRRCMEAERRQVTIVFTDMAGFTTFSERSGEEAAFRLMQEVAKLTGDAVRREGGVVQGFTGDGVMAVFGAPKAFEDAPLRACRAALGILDSIGGEANSFEATFGIRPQLRVGVNTGPAVLGEVQGNAGGVTVMGDTVNVAARLQTVAIPGTIFLTEATQKLVGGQINSEFVGEHQFKGKAETLKLYKLTGLRRDTTRFRSTGCARPLAVRRARDRAPGLGA
ncbi:MAG TPA: adenylate/guanylate cyclase domain-containing protein [Roseiarcus sp.]|nr:adenylate/guanylate cyclase domain-containing protein [Roseiarcus sp.]